MFHVKQLGLLAFVGFCILAILVTPVEAKIAGLYVEPDVPLAGATVPEQFTVTVDYDDPKGYVIAYLDGEFHSAVASPFEVNIDLTGKEENSYELRVEAYDAKGKLIDSATAEFEMRAAFAEVTEHGAPLVNKLEGGAIYTLRVGATGKLGEIPEDVKFPLVLNHLNSALKVSIRDNIFEVVAVVGLQAVEREIAGGVFWGFVPSNEKYTQFSLKAGESSVFLVDEAGIPVCILSDAAPFPLGLPSMRFPGKRIKPGETWTSEMPTALDLTQREQKIVVAEHTLTQFETVEGRECAVIESRYSLDGPLTVRFGEHPFTFSSVTTTGTRQTYYDYKTSEFILAQERVKNRISITTEEMEALEALFPRKEEVVPPERPVPLPEAPPVTPRAPRPTTPPTPTPRMPPMMGPWGMGMGAPGVAEGVPAVLQPFISEQTGKVGPEAVPQLRERGLPPRMLMMWRHLFTDEALRQLGLPPLGEVPAITPTPTPPTPTPVPTPPEAPPAPEVAPIKIPAELPALEITYEVESLIVVE